MSSLLLDLAVLLRISLEFSSELGVFFLNHGDERDLKNSYFFLFS